MQNFATGNPYSYVPTMPGYDIGTAQWGDMRTVQDQVHWLYLRVMGDATDLQKLLDEYRAAIEEGYTAADRTVLRTAEREIAALKSELIALIEKIKDDVLVADPTSGSEPVPSETAVSRSYAFARPFATFAAEFDAAGVTAGGLDRAGITARAFDVTAGLYLYEGVR